MDTLLARVSTVEDTAVAARVSSASNRRMLDALADRVASAETRMSELETRVRAIEGSSQKASLANARIHSQLKQRMVDVESKVARAPTLPPSHGGMDKLLEDVEGLKESITELNFRLASSPVPPPPTAAPTSAPGTQPTPGAQPPVAPVAPPTPAPPAQAPTPPTTVAPTAPPMPPPPPPRRPPAPRQP